MISKVKTEIFIFLAMQKWPKHLHPSIIIFCSLVDIPHPYRAGKDKNVLYALQTTKPSEIHKLDLSCRSVSLSGWLNLQMQVQILTDKWADLWGDGWTWWSGSRGRAAEEEAQVEVVLMTAQDSQELQTHADQCWHWNTFSWHLEEK